MSSCIYHSKIYTETLFAAIASVFGLNVRNSKRERESRIAIPSELFSSSEMEMEIEIQVALLLICFPSWVFILRDTFVYILSITYSYDSTVFRTHSGVCVRCPDKRTIHSFSCAGNNVPVSLFVCLRFSIALSPFFAYGSLENKMEYCQIMWKCCGSYRIQYFAWWP